MAGNQQKLIISFDVGWIIVESLDTMHDVKYKWTHAKIKLLANHLFNHMNFLLIDYSAKIVDRIATLNSFLPSSHLADASHSKKVS